jgi:tetratricopeptide (TPR) repeat protein
MRKLNRRSETAASWLNTGKLDIAEREFRKIAAASSRGRQSIALYNIAVCFLRTGRFEEALSVLCELEASHATRTLAMRPFRGWAPYAVASTYLRLGDIDAADTWYAHAKKSSPVSNYVKNHLVFDALRLVRLKHYVEGDRFFQQHFREMEGFLPGNILRGLRVQHAFAAHHAGAPTERVQQLLAAAQPFEPGEYAPLAIGWPELHDFLIEQGLQ